MHTSQLSTAPPQKNAPLRHFLLLCAAFALLKLAIQVVGNILAQHAGYGIFRDEMYYLICGRHLAFGYVDQPPLTALQARLTEILFGYGHMWSLRLFSALAGAAKVFLTGLIVRALGGNRLAASLAMLGVIVVGVYLGIDGFLSMNSFEPVFWMTCALALIHIVQIDPEDRAKRHILRNCWIILGISAGLGLENKDNIVFFLVAVLIALLLTPQRRILRSRWFALSLAIIVLLALPNLLWQIHYHFPTLEWLNDVRHSDKDVKLSPLHFLMAQMMMLTPWTILLWLSGIFWLLFAKAARPFRFLGVLYLVFLPVMMALNAKDYYLAPIYPLYFAAGAVLWVAWASKATWRRALIGLYALLLVIGFFLTVPFSIPVLPPQQFLTWSKIMHFQPKDSENHSATILPQFYADRFGWHEMVEKVAAIYNALPPDQRAVTGIFTGNYGEASAINLYGPKYGLPVAISGHQNYWIWGPHGYTGQEMIIIAYHATVDSLQQSYASCAVAGRLDNPLAMPWEQGPIFLCRGRKATLASDWKDFRFYY
ncbi:ArnT family glycosyltransferase [Paracidobacterium acidisoli]|uniref:Phospholipid carrier-dependent glycosyltransferase n=1 Tax=Paracidobacterium acidisoli TaxID=2303751 RepID=A0A372ITY2_9BACT|nr:glycosyltransferase family 39 protein [Paracidobacterium acidisoli]MBT9329664.1 glycosyltransferase family 39 protein [Paracidobacterium acidisoli]